MKHPEGDVQRSELAPLSGPTVSDSQVPELGCTVAEELLKVHRTYKPAIDALILHRHVDHAHEGGLRLGLWTRRSDSVCAPERRRRIAEVFAGCDTAAWPACADFALPVVGLARWEDWRLPAAAK